jgi:dephospho-CoA kinase
VTGGIGVGKSAVAEAFARRGAHVISADDIGHEVLREDRKVQKALIEAFGPEVIGPGGQPDRMFIGEKVFGNHDALARLNRIVHPPLLERLRSRIDAARHDPALPLVVVDAALITEWGIEDWFDLLIVVTAPEDQVRARLRTKGLTDEQINRRIASQLPEAARRGEPDIVVRNDGDRRKLEGLVEHVMRELVERG